MSYKVKNRMKFLSEASKILASSLDYTVTLSSIARLVVTNIANFCMIDLLDESGKLYRMATHIDDPKKKDLAQQMIRYPADPRNKEAIYEAARTGKAILVKKLTNRWLKKASRFPQEHNVVAKLGMNSLIFVPLKSRNKVIGVLTLASFDKNFSYGKDDVVLAQELAVRAGLAVDNARLFSETREALKLRDLFISMAAHELRTPITTISGYAQLLASKLSGTQKVESKWVTDLSWETQRLTYLVNELLEVNRIKAGSLNYVWRECSMEEVIKRAISDLRFTYPTHEIIFQNEVKKGKDKVIGDFNKLLQLIINLLDNGAKFSSPKTKIVVKLKEKLSYLQLSIEDQGKGIPSEDLDKIFKEFYQGISHNKEGLGVGLFLVKSIIKKHKGSIKVSSKEGKGTKVEIKLPKIK